ncbi:hypothetical protein ACLQ2S_00100 [Micromonospora sp. DT48]|uniref:hypothetical protein n=1 Tax=unclassified Micromonospora TaxID=2617518 RepID=UPI001328D92D|nr:hypothetical protein [Micromonospora sp. CP22]MTK00995.1 hypothetical protein [Micromonospora sp. CP22]
MPVATSADGTAAGHFGPASNFLSCRASRSLCSRFRISVGTGHPLAQWLSEVFNTRYGGGHSGSGQAFLVPAPAVRPVAGTRKGLGARCRRPDGHWDTIECNDPAR